MKFMGHPIHTMLIVFPLGLLLASLGFDAGFLATDNRDLATVSFWMISAGILGGLLAAVFGAIDWWGLPWGTRAKTIGLWHGGGNIVVVLLFFGSWALRLEAPGHLPSAAAVTLSCFAVAVALIAGWLGGELVNRMGIGVDSGAHENSPNSLSGRPASDRARKRRVRAPRSSHA